MMLIHYQHEEIVGHHNKIASFDFSLMTENLKPNNQITHVEVVPPIAVVDKYAPNFKKVVTDLKKEGSYRVFTTIARQAGGLCY